MSLCESDIIYLVNENDRCDFVRENCPYDYINFYAFHFCYFNANFFFSFPIYISILFLLFYLLSDTSNNFFSIGMTKIVEILKIGQNLAGVTFLALGNGACDVISSLVASSEMEGIEFSIGALLGSGMFLTSFSLGFVLFFGGNIQVTPNMFNRDIILFLISLAFLILISYNGKIHYFESLGFIGIFILNVILAIIQDKNLKKEDLLLEEDKLDEEKNNTIIFPEKEEESTTDFNSDYNINSKPSTKEKEQDEFIEMNEKKETSRSNSILAEMIIKDIKNEQNQIKNTKDLLKELDNSAISLNINTLKTKLKKYYFTYKEQ